MPVFDPCPILSTERADDSGAESTNCAANGLKKAAADWAVAQLKDGMVVGLGSRSTAAFAVSAISRLVRDGLRIIGISTSEKTSDQARSLAIPLATLGEYPKIDMTIDGADEVEMGSLTLIKGGRRQSLAREDCGRCK
jgi:ribose 5-phosphate isomerase A